GYTGASFQRFFGSAVGMGLAIVALSLWAILPLGLGYWRFQRKDF
ncbi:MAG: ABC transporter permease, partial [Gemmatimonadales bacterium]|nr:ABC transporter permease [Gemmatimonadales bacterium]